jgi:serine/threonine protein kinase
MSSPTNFAALEPAIVSACAQHEREGENDRNYSRCLPFGKYFVKFGSYSSFYPEVVTLDYLADLAKSDASAPRVPQVYHFFHDNGRMAYVVMEYIELIQVSAENLAPKAAQAVRWMRRVPAPHDVILGPKGNGPARHVVLKNCEAPLDFASLGALERYLNKVCLLTLSASLC